MRTSDRIGFCLELSCGCTNLGPERILHEVRCRVKDEYLCGDSVRACLTEGHSIPISEALEIAQGSEAETEIYNHLEARPAVINTPGISFCPGRCGYAGWIDPSEMCSRTATCPNCGNPWVIWQLLPLWIRYYCMTLHLWSGVNSVYRDFDEKKRTYICASCNLGRRTCAQCVCEDWDSLIRRNDKKSIDIVEHYLAWLIHFKLGYVIYQLLVTSGSGSQFALGLFFFIPPMYPIKARDMSIKQYYILILIAIVGAIFMRFVLSALRIFL